MKTFKLTQQYVLGREGFVIGLKFDSESEQYYNIRRKAEKMYGQPWNRIFLHNCTPDPEWGYFRSKDKWGSRKPYIGFKTEAQLSMLLLSIKDIQNVSVR